MFQERVVLVLGRLATPDAGWTSMMWLVLVAERRGVLEARIPETMARKQPNPTPPAATYKAQPGTQ